MNYPLAEAILGFAGGSHLDLDVVRRHHEYHRSGLRVLDGPEFAGRVMELAAAYDPAVVAVQLNLLGSHDAPRMRTVMGGDLAGVRLATLLQATMPGAPCVYYGDEIGLQGGNDPECRAGFPWDPGHWEPGLRDTIRALLRLRSAERALRDGSLRVAGAAGSAVAFERAGDGSRFIVAVNAGENPEPLSVQLEVELGGAAGRLVPIDLPGLGGVAEAVVVDGSATIDLAARSGAVLRVV